MQHDDVSVTCFAGYYYCASYNRNLLFSLRLGRVSLSDNYSNSPQISQFLAVNDPLSVVYDRRLN